MQGAEGENLTDLLLEWRHGKESAFQRLAPLIVPELHKLAAYHMQGERRGHMLQTTALVNEVWLRLAGQGQVAWENRAHFFAAAACMMRRILIDHARTRGSCKRGGGAEEIVFDDALAMSDERPEDLLLLDEALRKLARDDPRKSRVVELRFFGGMNVDETAQALGVSPNTVIRDWKLARAWLRREIASP
jgi:RNA polymerase sigma factor (TIGR02999 family)